MFLYDDSYAIIVNYIPYENNVVAALGTITFDESFKTISTPDELNNLLKTLGFDGL